MHGLLVFSVKTTTTTTILRRRKVLLKSSETTLNSKVEEEEVLLVVVDTFRVVVQAFCAKDISTTSKGYISAHTRNTEVEVHKMKGQGTIPLQPMNAKGLFSHSLLLCDKPLAITFFKLHSCFPFQNPFLNIYIKEALLTKGDGAI